MDDEIRIWMYRVSTDDIWVVCWRSAEGGHFLVTVPMGELEPQ